jgi:Mce-associated membrane protein
VTAPDLPAATGEAGADRAAAAPAAEPSTATTQRTLLRVLALLAVVLAVLLALLVWQLVTDDADAAQGPAARVEAREDVLRAAAQSALNLTSIDHREFDGDVERVLEGATGVFRADFESRSKDLKQVLTENEVVSEGKVVETALVELEVDTATALVVVDSNVRNTAVPEGRVNTYRMKLQLERRDGRWLTSQLEFVG